MATIVTGARDTQNTETAVQKRDVADKIFLLQPSVAPLTMLTAKLNKKGAVNPKVEWFEDVLQPDWAAVINNAGTGTIIQVTDAAEAAYFKVGDTIKVPSTGEVMRVSVAAAENSDTFTVVRGWGTTEAVAIDGSVTPVPILIIGTAKAEGGSAGPAKSTKKTLVDNYLQIFETPVELTGTEDATAMYGGPDRAYQRKKKGIEFLRDIEKTFLYGEKKLDTGGTHPCRATGGILSFITTNITDAGGALTEAEWEAFLQSVFAYGSDTRFVFCSPLVLSVIAGFARGKLQMRPTDKTYGIQITDYISPHGTVHLIMEKALAGATYGGYAIALDMEEVIYRYLQGRDMKLETDIQPSGDDVKKDQYLGEIGLELHNQKKHGVLMGVTS